MVHEEVKIFSLGICKLLLKPLQSLLTVPALVMPGLVGVQIEKTPDGQILNRLDKAVFITWMIAKPLPEDVAIIMVAHQQPQGNLKPGEVALEVIKSVGLAPMRQVSRDDTTLRIRVIPVDVVDTALKRCCRITAIQRSALGNKVGVGEVNDFHSSGYNFQLLGSE